MSRLRLLGRGGEAREDRWSTNTDIHSLSSRPATVSSGGQMRKEAVAGTKDTTNWFHCKTPTCRLIGDTLPSLSNKRSPGEMSGEHVGSPLSLQAQGHHSASSTPQTLGRMSEGDVTVLPFGPASLDLPRQERPSLTRLYSQNGGFHLRILPDGTVSGGRGENDPYDVLRLKAVSVGVVVIKGETTGRYLAMNRNGQLYASQALNDECYFLETYEENHYNTYCSQKYSWYVALKRNGQPKAGPDTNRGQKAVFFLPRPVGSV